jgi:hypothetical protein
MKQASIKYLNRIVTSTRGHVDFRQVQIELHFIASQAQGHLAKFRCRSPLPLATGNGNSQKGKIIRIFLLQLGGVPEIFIGLRCVSFLQKFDS